MKKITTKYSTAKSVDNNKPLPYISRFITNEIPHVGDIGVSELVVLKRFEEYLEKYPYIETLIFEFGDYFTFKGYLKEKKVKVSTNEGIQTEIDYEPKVKLLTDCHIRLRYSVIDDTQDDKQRMEYFLEIQYKNNKHIEFINKSIELIKNAFLKKRENFSLKNNYEDDSEYDIEDDIEPSFLRPFTVEELTKASLFKVALLNYKLSFFGNNEDLTDLVGYLFKTDAPKIRALSYIGYDEKSRGYYFPEFAYNAKGERLKINADKYFTDANIKPFKNCNDTIISGLEPIDLQQFITLINTAYGYKGLLALGFYVSSLFSNQIFKHYGFFPILSLYGSPHTGKSFLSKLLNRCLFIDSEGQTMTSSNTAKGELRKISQTSSLVCALLEGRKNSRFDYDSILPLYNRNTLYSRATASKDNSIHDLHFRTALSFVWNHECFTSKAAKERVISLYFPDSDITENTRKEWIELNKYTPEQLARVGDFLLRNRTRIESELIGWITHYATSLKNDGVIVSRIAENYAIALGSIRCFMELTRISTIDTESLARYTFECARNKLEIAKTELHLAEQFFELIRELDNKDTQDHGVVCTDGTVVIHLPTTLSYLKSLGNFADKEFDRRELVHQLKKHERFITIKSTRYFGNICDAYHFKKTYSIILKLTALQPYKIFKLLPFNWLYFNSVSNM